jgi:hypothetical protein
MKTHCGANEFRRSNLPRDEVRVGEGGPTCTLGCSIRHRISHVQYKRNLHDRHRQEDQQDADHRELDRR